MRENCVVGPVSSLQVTPCLSEGKRNGAAGKPSRLLRPKNATLTAKHLIAEVILQDQGERPKNSTHRPSGPLLPEVAPNKEKWTI